MDDFPLSCALASCVGVRGDTGGRAWGKGGASRAGWPPDPAARNRLVAVASGNRLGEKQGDQTDRPSPAQGRPHQLPEHETGRTSSSLLVSIGGARLNALRSMGQRTVGHGTRRLLVAMGVLALGTARPFAAGGRRHALPWPSCPCAPMPIFRGELGLWTSLLPDPFTSWGGESVSAHNSALRQGEAGGGSARGLRQSLRAGWIR